MENERKQASKSKVFKLPKINGTKETVPRHHHHSLHLYLPSKITQFPVPLNIYPARLLTLHHHSLPTQDYSITTTTYYLPKATQSPPPLTTIPRLLNLHHHSLPTQDHSIFTTTHYLPKTTQSPPPLTTNTQLLNLHPQSLLSQQDYSMKLSCSSLCHILPSIFLQLEDHYYYVNEVVYNKKKK